MSVLQVHQANIHIIKILMNINHNIFLVTFRGVIKKTENLEENVSQHSVQN